MTGYAENIFIVKILFNHNCLLNTKNSIFLCLPPQKIVGPSCHSPSHSSSCSSYASCGGPRQTRRPGALQRGEHCPGHHIAHAGLPVELQLAEDFTITEKAPSRAFSWLQVPQVGPSPG